MPRTGPASRLTVLMPGETQGSLLQLVNRQTDGQKGRWIKDRQMNKQVDREIIRQQLADGQTSRERQTV